MGAKAEKREMFVTSPQFYRTIVLLSVPIILQQLLRVSVDTLDSIMLGRIDQVQMSAVSQAQQIFFIFYTVCSGFSAGCSVLIAQYWGRRDTESIKTLVAIGVRSIAVFGVLFSAVVMIWPERLLRIYSSDPELIRQRMQHSLFRDKIRDFSFADIDDPGKQQQVVTDLLHFLAKWLYHHILGSDIMIGKLPPLEEWMIRDNPCEFTDDYLTGIEIVDLEHQQLFCIVERAYQLVKSNDVITCYDELLSIIHELTDYTVTHFADEEAYMEKIGYEGLAAQKNAHASFVARLESINLIELDENPQKYMESLIEFLLGWLINHILYSDKKIPVQA